MTNWLDELRNDGFTILPGVLAATEVAAACRDCMAALADPAAAGSVLVRSDGRPHGARNLLRLWPGVAHLARKPALAEPLLQVLGPHGGIVRGLYFDKPPGSDWALPWHRDLTIAVRRHGKSKRFCKPTRKAGIPHVEAPCEILAGMVTARIHLDPMQEDNGPLRVIPGSHSLPAANQPSGRELTLQCQAGDVLLMRRCYCMPASIAAPRARGTAGSCTWSLLLCLTCRMAMSETPSFPCASSPVITEPSSSHHRIAWSYDDVEPSTPNWLGHESCLIQRTKGDRHE